MKTRPFLTWGEYTILALEVVAAPSLTTLIPESLCITDEVVKMLEAVLEAGILITFMGLIRFTTFDPAPDTVMVWAPEA